MLEKKIETILENFISHYENRGIREIYKKDNWTPQQIAKAWLNGNRELNELSLHYVVLCECEEDKGTHTNEHGIRFCENCRLEK